MTNSTSTEYKTNWAAISQLFNLTDVEAEVDTAVDVSTNETAIKNLFGLSSDDAGQTTTVVDDTATVAE